MSKEVMPAVTILVGHVPREKVTAATNFGGECPDARSAAGQRSPVITATSCASCEAWSPLTRSPQTNRISRRSRLLRNSCVSLCRRVRTTRRNPSSRKWYSIAMSPDRIAILQAEFESLSKRLKETQESSQRRAILKKARQVIEEMDALVGTDKTKQNVRDSKTQGSD